MDIIEAITLHEGKSKSKQASEVLQLMDKDKSYQEALGIVLKKNPKLDKDKLEAELDKYV